MWSCRCHSQAGASLRDIEAAAGGPRRDCSRRAERVDSFVVWQGDPDEFSGCLLLLLLLVWILHRAKP